MSYHDMPCHIQDRLRKFHVSVTPGGLQEDKFIADKKKTKTLRTLGRNGDLKKRLHFFPLWPNKNLIGRHLLQVAFNKLNASQSAETEVEKDTGRQTGTQTDSRTNGRAAG